MKIEENLRLSLLIELYGNLLTKKQNEILKDFLDNNISLSEIAEMNNITRQAVNDLIKRTFKLLEDFENKLQFLSKFQSIEACIKKELKLLENSSLEKTEKCKIENGLNKILEVL